MWIIQRFDGDVSRLSTRIAFLARWWGSSGFRGRNFLYSAMIFSNAFRI